MTPMSKRTRKPTEGRAVVTGWNRIATYVSGVVCASLLTLGGCSGGSGTSSSLPSQPSQVQNPGQATAPPITTTSNVRIYATNEKLDTVTVYDEEGHQFANCPFPGLLPPFGIAFDSNNQRLYVTHGGPGPAVLAFDLNGNPIKTKGSFPGADGIITFDSNNHQFYTFSFGGGPPHQIPTVFDEEGNPVTVSGNFLNVVSTTSAAFDPFNHHIYTTNLTAAPGVTVIDEQGNAVAFSGQIGGCDGVATITFNPISRHFFVSGVLTPMCTPPGGSNVTVFDEAGNIIPTKGTFPNVFLPRAMTFDTNSHRLYVLNDASITVYDEDGNQITTNGTFPNGGQGDGIVAAPQ